MRYVHLICDRIETNSYKYWELTLQQDIFGNWCLFRRWGRIGTEATETRTFPTREQAEAKFTSMEKAQRSQGYIDAALHTKLPPAEIPAPTSIVAFVPKTQQPILNHTIAQILPRTQEMANFLKALKRDNIIYVGQLVQAHPQRIFQAAKAHPRVWTYLQRCLQDCNLNLGAVTPGWRANTKTQQPPAQLPLWQPRTPKPRAHLRLVTAA